jgi:DNA-binding GntR family transcriptional regulator
VNTLRAIPKNTTLSEKAYEVIREAIILNKIKPGEVLAEEPLARQLGISRTPIKAALRKLVFEQIARVNGKNNIEVSNVTERDVSEMTEVRAVLEPLAVSRIPIPLAAGERNALKRICGRQDLSIREQDGKSFIQYDFEFHTKIAELSRNGFLCEMVQRANLTADRYLVLSGTLLKYMQIADEEHWAVVNALEHSNLEEAAEAMRSHVLNVSQRMLIR